MRCLALFIYKDENEHMRFRQEISNYLKKHKGDYTNIELQTEIALMNIDEYIIYTQKLNIWGGELEKYAPQEILVINIADRRLITNNLLFPNIINLFNVPLEIIQNE